MVKSVKLADIAEKVGVSVVTVSKALSGQKGVSEELRIKIKKKAEEMGYQSSSARYKERSGNDVSYTFGVVVSDRFLAKYESFYWNLYQEVATAQYRKDVSRCWRYCGRRTRTGLLCRGFSRRERRRG